MQQDKWQHCLQLIREYLPKDKELIPNDDAEAFVRTLKPKTEAQMPEKASERPVEAKKDVPAVVLHENTEDAPERRLGAENGHKPEKAQEAGLDLESMSRLDILRAIAAGKLEAASVG